MYSPNEGLTSKRSERNESGLESIFISERSAGRKKLKPKGTLSGSFWFGKQIILPKRDEVRGTPGIKFETYFSTVSISFRQRNEAIRSFW